MSPFSAGSLLVFAAFGMKSIIPLRAVALLSNVAFLTYGLGMHLAPVWVLHAALLPMNTWRLWQELRPLRLEPPCRAAEMAASPA